MKKQIKELIEKYELERKTILELIQNSETTEKCFKELAVERFLRQLLTDLRALKELEQLNEEICKDSVRKCDSRKLGKCTSSQDCQFNYLGKCIM